jgi:hypothetical protein
MMPRRPVVVKRLRPGDAVIRRHRLLKTQGTVLRFGGEDHNGASRVWIKWAHPDTLPNPSLEVVDDLELVEETAPAP